VRLAILDEPFRGLDRQQRCELLARCRRLWAKATLLCITHDVESTTSFDRVLVLEQGKIVEQGHPIELAKAATSRYRAMLKFEQTLSEQFRSDGHWRRLRLQGGKVKETNLRRTAW